MKKFVLAAVAASMIASPIVMAAPAAAAPAKQTRTVVKQKPNGRVVIKQKAIKKTTPIRQRAWQRGQRFDHRQARNYRQIDYRQFNRQYRGHLNAPPRGYRYVQSGNDVVLVGITSGIVAAVLANLIR